MKLKKLIPVVLGFTIFTIMLAGCGNKDVKTADGKDIVRFVVGGSAEELGQYQKAVDAFNEQSEKTHVNFVGLPADNFGEKLITQLKSKNPPDCFYAEEHTFGQLNQSEVLLNLNDYLDQADSPLKRSDIPKNILAGYTFGDEVRGVPVDCNPMVIYYNADLIKELGIKSPQEYFDEGIWNFEALQTISEQLRDKEKIGFVYENWWGPLYTLLFDKDDPIYNEEMTKANFDTDRVKAGLEYLSKNIDSKAFTFAGKLTSGESPDTLFVSGQAGLLYAGRWYVPDFKELKFTYDVIPFPYYETASQQHSSMPATPLVINKKAANPDAVWEFVSFYCNGSGQRLRMEGAGNAVPTIAGLDDIVLSGKPEHAQYFLDAVPNAFLYPKIETLKPGLTEAVTDEVEKMLGKEQDVETTLANINKVVKEKLEADN